MAPDVTCMAALGGYGAWYQGAIWPIHTVLPADSPASYMVIIEIIITKVNLWRDTSPLQTRFKGNIRAFEIDVRTANRSNILRVGLKARITLLMYSGHNKHETDLLCVVIT